jgi:integrase
VVQAYQVVDQVLRYALRTRYISVDPADDIQLPRKFVPEKTALTHDQVRDLAEAAEVSDDGLRPGLRGLRYGEIAALSVGDVDVARRRLKVSRSVTAVAGMGMVEGVTKTHQARSIPLPEFVMDLVAKEIKVRSPAELVFLHNDGR